MTAFQGDVKSPEPGNLAEEPKVIPIPAQKSRIKNDPELWRQAGEISDMLSYCRPHNSKVERKFIAKFIVPLGVKYDKAGNAYKIIGDNPTVMWSCHTDTVHTVQGWQRIQYWHKANGDVIYEVNHDGILWAKQSSCLGADDTVGVWLMMEMIRAKIPGLYIFHRGEEVGCIGSKWIAEKGKKLLEGIKFAIAFDRRAEKSIITHQMSNRCCSDEFAKSLAEQLGMGHECDTTGSTTDTRSYVDLIPECTNLSVGYYNAHSRSENTNIDYLFNLRDALLKIDVSKLVEKRKAGENERLVSQSYDGAYGGYGGYYRGHGWGYIGKNGREWKDGRSGFELAQKYKGKAWMDDYEYDNVMCLWYPKSKDEKDAAKPGHADAVRMVRLNPTIIVDILEGLGIGPAELRKELLDYDVNNSMTIFL